MPEPEKGLEINIALVKQFTGGDTYTGRFLNENPIEFRPEFKIFINTNHLPRTSDDTVFSKTNGYRPLSNRPFVGDLRRRFEIKPDCKKGNVIIGLSLANTGYSDDTGEKLPWD